MTTVLGPVEARTIADVVLAVPHVAALGGGGAGAATYLPGERIRGVRLQGDDVVVHLVVDRGVPSLPAVGRAVREAIRARHPEVDRVDVVIEDITDEPESDSSPPQRDRHLSGATRDSGASATEDFLQPGDAGRWEDQP